MSRHKKDLKEKLAYVNHEGETAYIILTGAGRNCILKETIVMQLTSPVQVRKIVVSYMPNRMARILMKKKLERDENAPEHRKNKGQERTGPQGRSTDAGTGDMPLSEVPMPLVEGQNAGNEPKKEGDE